MREYNSSLAVIVKVVVASFDPIMHFFSHRKGLLLLALRDSMQPPGSAPKSLSFPTPSAPDSSSLPPHKPPYVFPRSICPLHNVWKPA